MKAISRVLTELREERASLDVAIDALERALRNGCGTPLVVPRRPAPGVVLMEQQQTKQETKRRGRPRKAKAEVVAEDDGLLTS